ncbi:MAG: putative manganese transporter [Dorea sp.]
MEMLLDVIIDTCLDCLKMLPFLFVAFLMIEALEHYSSEFTAKLLAKVGKAGPIVGAVAGCVPQCGFSVMAANLYAGGIVSVGTLLSVFIATSDEAILIILGNPDYIGEVGTLLITKVVIAIVAGYIIDIFFREKISVRKENGNLCHDCGCHNDHAGIMKPAWNHTVKIFVYLLIFTGILNLCIEVLGIDRLSAILLGNTIFQPVIAAVIGLIPNCAASVILTQLYLSGAISFASVIAGLCTGAGIGLVVLFRMNHNKKENFKILGALYVIAVIAGIILEIGM